jgi:hypothetical protein
VVTTLMVLSRQSWRPLARWKWLHCAIAGTLMNAVGLMAPHVGLLTAPAAQVALVQSLTPLLTAAFGEQLLDAVSGRCADAFDRSIDNRPPQPFDEDRFHDRNSLLHPGAETEEAGNKGRAGL